MPDVFAVPVFLICFRETLECVIIVSVLLAFLRQTLNGPDTDTKVYKKLRNQVWFGVGLGFFVSLVIAAALIGSFYTVGIDHWSGSEGYWEGSFALFASIVITIVGFGLLRIGKMQEKWRVRFAKAIEAPLNTGTSGRFTRTMEKYAMFILPFVTVLREGIEAIIFVAGVSFTAPATAFPLPAVTGLLFGCFVGYILYKTGTTFRLQVFLVISTCFLYLVAAGLFSRAVGYFEMQKWNNVLGADVSELGNGPGTYDIDQSVWHVNCCSPNLNGGGEGGWGIFNALFGWTNSATYGTVISYNLYWLVVITAFVVMRFRERKTKDKSVANLSDSSHSSVRDGDYIGEKTGAPTTATVEKPHTP